MAENLFKYSVFIPITPFELKPPQFHGVRRQSFLQMTLHLHVSVGQSPPQPSVAPPQRRGGRFHIVSQLSGAKHAAGGKPQKPQTGLVLLAGGKLTRQNGDTVQRPDPSALEGRAGLRV